MRIVTATEAASLIRNDWTVVTGGFGSCGHPEEITAAIATRFSQESRPRDLTLLFAAGSGDGGIRGLNRLALPGLVKRAIGGYWGLVPALGRMVRDNVIEAHNWPQGVISHLFRAIAAGEPGVVTKIGLQTFIDPEFDGGCLNATTDRSLIEKIWLQGEKHLFYPRIHIDCAIIRGTSADTKGNLSMEREVSFQDALAQAQAVHNCGGIVIAQVGEIVPAGAIPPQLVKVPGIFVDFVVTAAPEFHTQTYGEVYNHSYVASGQWRYVRDALPPLRSIIARRAFQEIRQRKGGIVNLGIGIPSLIGAIATAGSRDDITLTVESGYIGGIPAAGLSFGATAFPDAIIEQSQQFDFYDGGGIDLAFLGFGQVDSAGNVNVSKFCNRIPGAGGFINISQSAKQLVFCGAFTADGLEVDVGDAGLKIRREGKIRKFVSGVDHLTFNGADAVERGVPVTYVTERGVFKLCRGGLQLIEVAPGIDVDRDIIAKMESNLIIEKVLTMDQGLFEPECDATRVIAGSDQ